MYHLSMIYCHSSYRMNVRNVGGIFIGQILNENHSQLERILNENHSQLERILNENHSQLERI